MIETERLLLRAWRPADARAHHALAGDPRVVATLGQSPSREQSARVVQRQNELLARYGYCFWAMERRETRAFVGWCGLMPGKPPIARDVELGWTLAPHLWGAGLAREAAEAVLAFAWARTDLASVASVTTPGNVRSWGLMKRLGMIRYPDEDFAHPDLSPRDPLSRHILYRIDRPLDA